MHFVDKSPSGNFPKNNVDYVLFRDSFQMFGNVLKFFWDVVFIGFCENEGMGWKVIWI